MCSNHRAFTTYLLEENGCHCHCQRGLLGAATFVEEELELAATFVDKRAGGAAMDAYKKRHTVESKSERVERGKSRAKDVRNVGESGLPRQPAVAAIAALKREK